MLAVVELEVFETVAVAVGATKAVETVGGDEVCCASSRGFVSLCEYVRKNLDVQQALVRLDLPCRRLHYRQLLLRRRMSSTFFFSSSFRFQEWHPIMRLPRAPEEHGSSQPASSNPLVSGFEQRHEIHRIKVQSCRLKLEGL